MKNKMFVLAMLSLSTLCWAGSARDDAIDRLDNATDVMHAIMGMPDKGRSQGARHGSRRYSVPHGC